MLLACNKGIGEEEEAINNCCASKASLSLSLSLMQTATILNRSTHTDGTVNLSYCPVGGQQPNDATAGKKNADLVVLQADFFKMLRVL